MKILCVHQGAGPHHVRLGLANAFMKGLNCEWHWWERGGKDAKSAKPAFDVFDEVEPDIFLGTTFDLDKATLKCIVERPHLKVGMVASNWGTYDDEIDFAAYPVLKAREDEIKLVAELKEKVGKPDFVWCHYSERWINVTHDKWQDELGVPPISLMNAADTIEYGGGRHIHHLASDISFVGGSWAYKNRALERTIVPLCHPVGRYNVKIWGWSKWSVPQYLGVCENSTQKDVFASAKICPNVSEPHSTTYGFDVVERVFKVPMAGGFLISDYVESIERDVFKNGECPFFRDVYQLEALIEQYLGDEEERAALKARQRDAILEAHTYFHRASTILEHFGMEEEAGRILDASSPWRK